MWLKDPISKSPSVALTLLVLATILMVAGIILECFTNLRSTHLLDELFGAAMALYGGHIMAFKNTDGPRGGELDPPDRHEISP